MNDNAKKFVQAFDQFIAAVVHSTYDEWCLPCSVSHLEEWRVWRHFWKLLEQSGIALDDFKRAAQHTGPSVEEMFPWEYQTKDHPELQGLFHIVGCFSRNSLIKILEAL